MQLYIKEQMERIAISKLNENEFEIIKIPVSLSTHSNIIRWLNSSEIIYKGKQYDVYKKHTVGNYIILYCLNDEAEDKLYSDLQNQVNNNSDYQAPLNNKSDTPVKV